MAQETKLKRKDLKEPDQFLVASNEFLDFLARNKSALIVVLVGLLAVAGGFMFIQHQKTSQTLEMETLYFKMTQVVENKKELGGEQQISELKSLLKQFDDGDQKLRALLLLGNVQYQNKRYDDALSTFQSVLDQTQTGTISFFLAHSGIAHLYEGKKDFQKAIEHYKKIVDHPGEAPLFYTYLGLARSYELASDSKNALLILREMQTKFPKHVGLEKVNLSIKRLES